MQFDSEAVAAGVVPSMGDDDSGFAEFTAGEFVTDHLLSEALPFGPFRAELSERGAASKRPSSTQRCSLHAASCWHSLRSRIVWFTVAFPQSQITAGSMS